MEKKYRYLLRRKYQGKRNWWKTTTQLVGIIDDEINGFSWFLYLGKSPQEAVTNFAKNINVNPWTIEEYPRDGYFFAWSGIKAGAIWFPNGIPGAGLLAHECFHALSYYMHCMEGKLTSETEEFLAYYLGFLVNQVEYLCKKSV